MRRTQLSHWGTFHAESDGVRLTSVGPHDADPEPNALIHNLPSAQHHPARIDRPYVRAGWLESGPGPAAGRGAEPFVPVSWERVLELLAGELRRVYRDFGGQAVFGGSYGWGSAGRFHHAQSQVHRFLNHAGGYVRSVGTYSYGASEIFLPRVLCGLEDVLRQATSWDSIAGHTDLVVAFGGISAKNAQVSSGGVFRHRLRSRLAEVRAAGTRIVSVSPIRDDTPEEAGAEWLAPRPGTDAALMLALAHTLITKGLAALPFLERYCVGYEDFALDVLGENGGPARDPEWAERVTGISADRIRALAVDMAAGRTLITVSWSLQRGRNGEQPLWLGVVLAAMLGQIGLPGGGFGHGYGSSAYPGELGSAVSLPSLPSGPSPVRDFIPVARIADMLLDPGGRYRFDGRELSYPDIRLVYWCGGNPFHHHQDLARLRRAFTRPDTVVVHDPFWTSTARHADIVLPTTMTVERDDFGMGNADPELLAMPALTRPHGEARDDYTIFSALADRLGVGEAFTEGRDAHGWLEHLYDDWRRRHDLPSFAEFWAAGSVTLPRQAAGRVLLADFRADPDSSPLPTPSGRIEIRSAMIESFDHPDFPAHPTWIAPPESGFPLTLLANQPKSRLHSQLDVGEHSLGTKIQDREPLRMHPDDAAARGISGGDVVRVFNEIGSLLAGVVVSGAVLPGVVQLSTGAWYDPDSDDSTFCRHGNPNVLIPDVPTSTLTQACAGSQVRVEIERFDGAPPPLTVHGPPPIAEG